MTPEGPWIILEELLGITKAEQRPNQRPNPKEGLGSAAAALNQRRAAAQGLSELEGLCRHGVPLLPLAVPGHEGCGWQEPRAGPALGGCAPAALIPGRLLPEPLRVAAIRLSINPVWIVEQSARFVCLVVTGSKVGIVPLQMSTSFSSLRKGWLH